MSRLTDKQIHAIIKASKKLERAAPRNSVSIVVESGRVEIDGNKVRLVEVPAGRDEEGRDEA